MFIGAIGAFYFNASYIDTNPQHLNISNTSNNIFNGNLCETLNAGVDLKKQVIQRGSKILQLHSYGSVKKVGKFSCIADGLIEPYLIKTNFSCGESGVLLSNQQRWRLQNKCRSFTKKTIKCSQYNEHFGNDIDRINYTRYQYNGDTYAFDLPEGNVGIGVFGRDFIESNTNVLASDVDKVQTLHNSFLMGAMICSIANSGQVNNVSSFCLRRPNRRECYGEFGDDFVNFPEHYFPTHEGGWGEQTPGYTGESSFPADFSDEWSYFEFNNIGGNFRLNTDVGVRYNPRINLNNYENLDSYTLRPFNPYNPGAMQDFELNNYHQISSYYFQAAREEIISFLSSNRMNTAQYYYDHLPRIFKGYGSIMSSDGNSEVFTQGSNHQFQAICTNGCRHLVITSHEMCNEKYSSFPVDTEVHCLPKYLNLRANNLAKIDGDVFSISGYDSVKIDDLVISFSPGTKFAEINDKVAKEQGSYAYHFNYLIPRLSFVFSGNKIINLSDAGERASFPNISNSDYIFSFNNIYYRHLFESYSSFISTVPNWIIQKGVLSDGSIIYDAYQMALMSYFFFRNDFLCKDSGLNNVLNSNGESYSADKTRCDGLGGVAKKRCVLSAFRADCNVRLIETFMGNLPGFSNANRITLANYFKLQKRVFTINNSDKLNVSNVLFKGISQYGFVAGARKNIFHGNMFLGFPVNELIDRGLPILSPRIGVKNYFGSGVNKNLQYEGGYENLYFSPNFLATGNREGHVRLDKNRLAYYEIDYPSEYPFLYNLCKSLDGTNPNPNFCNPDYPFSDTGTFSGEQYFSPFYYSLSTPENKAKNAGASFNHYDNSLYLKKFNPTVTPNFLVSFDQDPTSPMTYNQIDSHVESRYANFQTCTNHIDCGEDSYCYNDDVDYPSGSGICLSGEIRIDYLIVSNNTFKNHSFRELYFHKNDDSGKTRDVGFNHEFIATNGNNALIFNNILQNHQSDIYDLNFRGTHYRSEKNKNLVQVIERNLISNGSNGKATGEGNPESKMRFSNNVITDVRIGGYHAFFTPFYLNNTIVSSALTVLNDTQDRFASVESMKPYGVRHALFNNAVIRYFVTRPIIASPGQRAKQHAVDYNFSENLYFGATGETNSPWMIGRDYTSLNVIDDYDANLPIANYSYVDNSKQALPLVVDETTGESLSCFGNYLFGGSSANCSSPLTSLDTSGFMYGSFNNYFYDSSMEDGFNYGKLRVDTFDDISVYHGHSPSLSNFFPGSLNKKMPRVRFIMKHCYGLSEPNSLSLQRDAADFVINSNIDESILSSYECVTGDNKSTFYNESSINQLNRQVYNNISSAIDTRGAWGVLDVIKSNVGNIGCNEIQEILSSDKRASLIVKPKGLSVYRDFNGNYRAPSSSVGAFNLNCANN